MLRSECTYPRGQGACAPRQLTRNRHLTPIAGSVLTLLLLLVAGACKHAATSGPVVEVTTVPLAQEATALKITAIGGRVIGASPSQRIVLYARSASTWYVQPYADRPFTTVRPDGTWSNVTHPGLAYAALLVGPDFRPPSIADTLPLKNAIASAAVSGKAPVWRRWWFLAFDACAILLAVFAVHRLRVNQLRRQLSLRFEERLAERMRVAQILHDTLLQGVVSASMQLHVAADQLPEHSPARAPVHRVLQSMAQVLEEGRNTLRSLRSPMECTHDLERSFYRLPQELDLGRPVGLRVTMKGPVLPLQSSICGEIYCIGREALRQAFLRCHAVAAEVELRYGPSDFRLAVRYDTRDRTALDIGDMRESAARIGARLEIRNRFRRGVELRMTVPAHAAFESPHSERASVWTTGFRRRRPLLQRADASRGKGG